MEKTKLGIPAVLLALVTCLLGYYGGYVITGIVVGYILLKEENDWLKKMAVRVIAVMLCFSVASTVISLIPTLLSLLESFLYVFGLYLNLPSFIDRIFSFLSNALGVVKIAAYALLSVWAVTGKESKLPVLDDLLDKLDKKNEA